MTARRLVDSLRALRARHGSGAKWFGRAVQDTDSDLSPEILNGPIRPMGVVESERRRMAFGLRVLVVRVRVGAEGASE
jgi:hypothetical protein